MNNGANNYRRFLDGDDNGLVELIKEYKDGLIFFINGYVQNILIAEELTEETFFKLVVKKPKYTEKYSFKTWLYTIGRNLAINYVKYNAHHINYKIDDFDALLIEEENLERSYFIKERKIIIHKALAQINPDYREVLYLTYFEDISNEEAAKIMKKNRRQIENLIYRAKQALKSQLEKEGFEYERL